jgi:hypothetical protein
VNASIASDALDAELSFKAFIRSTIYGLQKAFFEQKRVPAVVLLIVNPRVTVATEDVQIESTSKQLSISCERNCSTDWKTKALKADGVARVT